MESGRSKRLPAAGAFPFCAGHGRVREAMRAIRQCSGVARRQASVVPGICVSERIPCVS